MSLLRVYSYNIINQCWYFAQLHILPFYRIEVDKSRHICVYTHALTSNVARILRNFIVCRQNIHEVDESCRLYVYHRIEVDKACHLSYCAYIHQSQMFICDYILSITALGRHVNYLYTILCHVSVLRSCHVQVCMHPLTSNVATFLYNCRYACHL